MFDKRYSYGVSVTFFGFEHFFVKNIENMKFLKKIMLYI